MSAPAIQARDVTKIYRRFLHRNQLKTLKSALLTGSLLSDLRPEETFTALEGVTFDVPKGSTFGVIGENGSGKSTLLKLVAGITKPTRGSLAVDGRVSALIELGAGFHPEISGRENVVINGIMLGLTHREVERRFDEIVAFAELEEFIDAPVKTYSSGMYMRLGFAVAIHVDPDVLLVDEVLAVGDEAFTRKCLDKISEFRRRGKDDPLRDPLPGPRREDVRRRALAPAREDRRRRRPQAHHRRLPDLRGRGRGGAAQDPPGPGREPGGQRRRPRPGGGAGGERGSGQLPPRPLGQPRGGDHGGAPARCPRPRPARLRARGGRDPRPLRARAPAGRGLRLRRGALLRRRDERVRHQHRPRGPRAAPPRRRGRGAPRPRQTSASSRAPTSWTWPRTGATARPTTTTAASSPSA